MAASMFNRFIKWIWSYSIWFSIMTPIFECAVSPLCSGLNPLLSCRTCCRANSRLGPNNFGSQINQNWFLATEFYLTNQDFEMVKGNSRHSMYAWFHNCCHYCIANIGTIYYPYVSRHLSHLSLAGMSYILHRSDMYRMYVTSAGSHSETTHKTG